ncbi:flagellar hook assembly protein FlgD [Sphingomonas corticis]|jgi:flagellar basal-body rod modification protein FlgD|uniref:Basal-body rod modification protein FlgD n=1 Tax=Sphingomonas corticis TaxID=2722791 RepID=A0ABX1CPD7_9SPHN|nr:flagellar hook capping FlgD N-terminal domain-containing protein [Sphingomonas corticis]NJR79759.1 flagellar hook assembly protein FlgD [Sphingomonas corticis]
MATSTFDATMSNLGITRTAAGTKVVTKAEAETLDQSDFLKLMTAQMKNQDPFSPVDNTQMVAQMAQFSQLSGISEMSSTLKAIQEKLAGGTAADAMAYVGRTVLTAGATAYGRSAGGLAGAVELPSDAGNVIVTINDANGQTLKTLSLGKQAAGTVTYDWDGKTDAGEDAGNGPFTVGTVAQKDGKTVPSTGLVWAPVHAVSNAGGETKLVVPGIGTIPASSVRQIG